MGDFLWSVTWVVFVQERGLEMIPKIIHYCWMSGEKYPALIEDCMESWHEHMPKYQFKKWDTSNFDVSISPYTREAMSVKKYAFVSDYVRLHALYTEGGIYLDSDIRVFKNFDALLDNAAFTGFESGNEFGVWLIAAEKGNQAIKEMLDLYTDKHFLTDNGEMDLTPNPQLLRPVFEKYDIKQTGEFQKNSLLTVYPEDYFSPLDYRTGKVNITENSYAMHLYNGAWMRDNEKQELELQREYYHKYENIVPGAFLLKWARLCTVYKMNGSKGVIDKIIKKLQ